MPRKSTKEEFVEKARLVHGNKYDYNNVVYNYAREHVFITCKEHGDFPQKPNNHLSGKGCPTCAGNEKLNFKDINKRLEELDSNFRFFENQVYEKNSKEYNGMCKFHGETQACWNRLQYGAYPGCCEGRKVTENNSLYYLRPDLLKYILNPLDAKNYTVGSNKNIWCSCPECGYARPAKIISLTKYGFSCDVCNDGMSVPEKFLTNILLKTKINFEPQKTFKWSKRKQYDFYVPSLNMIIETHGAQHYSQGGWKNKRTREEFENDNFKKYIAKENGIENYVVIDCRDSGFDWLKNNVILGLSDFLNIEEIDFNDVYAKSQKSKLIEACNYWKDNYNNPDMTVTKVAEIFNVARGTMRNWLIVGSNIGFCFYDAKIEVEKRDNRNKKSVLELSTSGEIIKRFKSIKEASVYVGVSDVCIGVYCKGKAKNKQGRIFVYESDYAIDTINTICYDEIN